MDVRFIATTSGKLSELSIVSGQLIYLSDINATYYDMGSTRRLISSMRLVSSLPSTSSAQAGVIYGIVNDDGNIDASVWDADNSVFRQMTGYVATTSTLGLVKPDGSTITIDSNGVISCHPEVTTLPASSIIYDNTISGLASTTSQGAIDEVKTISNDAVASASSAMSAAEAASIDAANASTAAAAASTAAEYAMELVAQSASVVQSYEARLEAVEAIASRLEAVEAVAAVALEIESPPTTAVQ